MRAVALHCLIMLLPDFLSMVPPQSHPLLISYQKTTLYSRHYKNHPAIHTRRSCLSIPSHKHNFLIINIGASSTMKTQAFVSALLAVVCLTSAAPTPDQTTAKSQPQVSTTSFPKQTNDEFVPTAPAPYPGNPYRNEFQYVNYNDSRKVDKNIRTKVHDAFGEWPAMMQMAMASIANTSDDTFDRWFPSVVDVRNETRPIDAREYVSGVFRQLLQPGVISPAAKEVMSGVTNDRDDYGRLGEGECFPSVRAYLSSYYNKFHVCPTGLAFPTTATDIECSQLGNRVHLNMTSLTATLVHEFFHLNEAGLDAPNSAGFIRDFTYGPGNCWLLRQGYLGRDAPRIGPSGANQQKAFINADSYQWFAINAWYNSACRKEFWDPVIIGDEPVHGMMEPVRRAAGVQSDVWLD